MPGMVSASWNVCLYLPRPPDIYIEIDASGSWGYGALLNNLWFQLQWSTGWKPIDTMAKELALIVLSCANWEPPLFPGAQK